ncbi:MAG: hypothetical protein WB870_11835 [Gallionellaceae bacterium]
MRHPFLPLSMLAAAAMLLGTAWIGDDAFITLRTIDNFVNGYGLRYNVAERVQAFTHPLWLMVLTPFYALTREPLLTPMLISVILSLGAFWLLISRISRQPEYGCLLVLAAVASRAISQFSTSGLETPLTFLLLALLVSHLYRPARRAWIAASIVGLLLLNRLDLAVLVGPAAVYLMFRARGWERGKVGVAMFFPILAWMIFSVVYYGAPFPNTAYAKLGTGFDSSTLMLRGLDYVRDFVLHDPLLALIIGMAVVGALRSRDWLTALLGVGIGLYVVYTIVIGGDFMSGRFFAAPGFLALCLLAREEAPHWLMQRTKAIGLIAVGVVGVLLVARITEPENKSIPANGINNERGTYYTNNGLLPVIRTWLATGAEPIHPWGLEGRLFKTMTQAHRRAVVSSSIGMFGYYGGPTVHNIDRLALSDAFLARLPAIPGTNVGHYQRQVPPGYVETALNAAPATDIEALSPLLNDITLATRAPLFADGRWGAIWRLLSGHYSWVYQADLYGARK